MKANKVPLPRGFMKELQLKSIDQLEALVADIELREGTTVGPLTRQREAVERVLRKQRKERAAKPEGLVAESEANGTGLPAVSIIDTSETSVGDMNFLMNRVPLTAAPFDRILREIALRLVKKTGGLVPLMEVKSYDCDEEKGQRFVTRWTIKRPMTLGELFTIEHVTRAAYECQISGHKKATPAGRRS